jgi:D-alanine-D-alanine ligase
MVRAVTRSRSKSTRVKPLRILVLMHPDFMPPDSIDGHSEKEINVWKTEYDVISTLRAAGHEVKPLGVQYELKPIRDEVETWKPHVVFNLLEQFHGEPAYDQNVASYLELLRVPYTGCNPRGLMLARGKALSKKLLAFHRIPSPAFVVFPMGRKVKRPAKLGFPLIVKSASEDSSIGIAQASVVDSDEKLTERVAFIHERVRTDAMAEQYIEGREIYVGVLGNDRLKVLPVWELEFGAMDEGQNRIATAKVKHDVNYQEKLGIVHGPAKNLTPELAVRIQSLAKRICRTLELDGYARVDFRLAADGVPYFLEANPNPEIAKIEEFAEAAKHDGIKYPELLHRILLLAIARGKAAGFNAESSGESESNGEAEVEGEGATTRNLPHARPARRR